MTEKSDGSLPFLAQLNEEVVQCRKCPRLVEWREKVAREKRASFMDWEYWGKPVPGLGDYDATHLIVGLAPAAHGGNRTGRMFTGDRSGDWLFAALHRAGVANQPNATHIGDGLELKDVYIAPLCHCAPPDNKPTTEEFANCSTYLVQVLNLRPWKSIMCLGGLSFAAVTKHFNTKGKFGHGQVAHTPQGIKIVACYHPSQQNTFTGRLTEEMLDRAIAEWLS